MKKILPAVVVLWMVLALEQAAPGPIVRGGLLLPVCCAVIFFLRNAASVLLTGAALCLDWIIHPIGIPLNAAVLPWLTVVWLQTDADRIERLSGRNPFLRLPHPLRLPVLTLVALLLNVIVQPGLIMITDISATGTRIIEAVTPAALIAIPVSGLLSLGLYLCDELGLRSTLQHHRF
ncbi:MAG: hypothetical protein KDA96_03905 [Planctomycetaceae bacterium]|nr:hypothetical protein [Planctomycetaceae bacterium]